MEFVLCFIDKNQSQLALKQWSRANYYRRNMATYELATSLRVRVTNSLGPTGEGGMYQSAAEYVFTCLAVCLARCLQGKSYRICISKNKYQFCSVFALQS